MPSDPFPPDSLPQPVHVFKGRGAVSRLAHRFTRDERSMFDDGWGADPAEAAHRAGCFGVQIPDVVPSTGRWAHHLAEDLLAGARLAGLLI